MGHTFQKTAGSCQARLAGSFLRILGRAESLYPLGRYPRAPLFMVHSALSAFGQVEGGAAALVDSLLAAAAAFGGTVVMAAHSDAPGAEDGEIPPPPLFDRARTPCSGIGSVAEAFRRRRHTLRSDHPILSFCAAGPRARRVLKGHRREAGLGFCSPAGALYREDALVLMLGTGYATCTALHLAEYARAELVRRAGGSPDTVTCRAFVRNRFVPLAPWHLKSWEDIAYRTDLFERLGSAFEETFPSSAISGALPRGIWRAVRIRPLVDFSIDRYPLFR